MPARLWFALLILVLALGRVGGAADGGREAAACRKDLARRLQVPEAEIRVTSERPVTFPDSSLGLPRPGEAVAAVLTPGSALVLKSGPGSYLYTASAGAFRYGGPRSSWRYSALWLEPVPDEPNLNGNLMQCSLAGTNPERLLEGVGEFRPMPDGSVLAVRRTSRSGHDLLYLAPGERRTARTLSAAFAFACPTLDSSGKSWAAFVRPHVGGAWTLVHNGLGAPPEEAVRLDLPARGMPQSLDWEGADPVVGIDGRYYERAGEGWRELTQYALPAESAMMMNKSERLEVRTVREGGSALTRVLSVWFTGDERVLATIEGLDTRDVTVSPGFEFAVLSGQGKAYAVDLFTGEALPLPASGAEETRLLRAPPAAWTRMEGWFAE